MMHMMDGFGLFALLWMTMGILFCMVIVAAVIWLLARWLNQEKTPRMPYTSQRQDSYQPYQQGYQPPQPPETSRESGQQYQYTQPQYEQPQVQYPQEQEAPWHG